MSETNSWFEDIEKKISSLRDKMVGDWSNILQLDRLLNLSKGIATSSPQCNECSNLKKQITEAVNDLSNWPHIIYEQQKDYESTLKIVSKHLEKTHGLVVSSNDTGKKTLRNIGLFFLAVGAALLGSSIIWGMIDPISMDSIALMKIGAPIFLFGLMFLIGFYIFRPIVRK